MIEDTDDTILLQADSTGEKEELFNSRKNELHIREIEQNIRERKLFAARAFRLTQLWIWFLILTTLLQWLARWFAHGLDTSEFITVVTSTTASVFGFWWLVGRYLYPSDKQMEKPSAPNSS